MSRPLQRHEEVARVIKAVDDASTVWEAEVLVSDLMGANWIPLPLSRGELITVHCRLLAKEAKAFGGHARTFLAVLGHLAADEISRVTVGLSSMSLGVLQPWVPLLDTVELIDARRSGETLILRYGYRYQDHHVDEHVLVLDVVEGLLTHAEVRAEAAPGEPITPHEAAVVLTTLMRQTNARANRRDYELTPSVASLWALMTARSRLLPGVITADETYDAQCRTLVRRFLRLKATTRLVEQYNGDREDLETLVTALVEFERHRCPAGWTTDAVAAFYSDRAPQFAGQGYDDLIGEVVMNYLVWRMGDRDYKPLVQAASDHHVRFLETL